MSNTEKTQVVVIGSGPGGYTAAFRAADLGLQVTLIERDASLGGVCLNVGCIPSKALLHVARVIEEVESLSKHGITFGQPKKDIKALLAWKDGIIKKLTTGLSMLAKQRKVKVMQGTAVFSDSHHVDVTHEGKTTQLSFEHAIIAVGSEPVRLPFLPDDARVMDSTGALLLEDPECELLVMGGGIIGMEMACVYHALGAKISVVELADQLISGCDKDIVQPLFKRVSKQYKQIYLKTKVTEVVAKKDGLWVRFEGDAAPKEPVRFDRVLAAVGRKPNGHKIQADRAGVQVSERGFISVDSSMRTNVPHIFAIGDVVGDPMLAHKSIPQGKIAAEVIAGKAHVFNPQCIAAVAYTDPEIAWVGLTETAAKAQGIAYEKGVFPWAASGRSLAMDRDEGVTKMLFDPKTHRVLGAGITGPNAGDLISEVALAIEMGCVAEDISLTIHPHPTLSETIAQATEAFEGTITDLYMPKKKEASNKDG